MVLSKMLVYGIPTKEMLEIKSPGIGMLPKYLDIIIGRPAKDDIPSDYPITWDSI